MWQGKDAADFKGTSMFKRVHGMLQAVFRARGLQRRAKGSSSDSIMPKRGLLAYDVYEEVYKQCQARGKLQAGQIDLHHLDPQDNTLASTFGMWVMRWHLHHLHTCINSCIPVAMRLIVLNSATSRIHQPFLRTGVAHVSNCAFDTNVICSPHSMHQSSCADAVAA